MKKRAVSMVLVLILVFTTLFTGSLALAEDPYPAGSTAEQTEASVYSEELPPTEVPSQETQPDEAPPADAPATAFPPDDLVAEETPSVESSPSEVPSEDALSTEPPALEEPGNADSENPQLAEEPNPTDAVAVSDFNVYAVGSNGKQYPGVAYLSVAAFNSMDLKSQVEYIQAADEIAELIESGIELTNVVFSLDENGILAICGSMPLKDAFEGDAIPEENAIEEPIPVESADNTPPEESVEQPAEQEFGSAGEENAAYEPQHPIAENVELAASVDVPIETIERPSTPMLCEAPLECSAEYQNANTLFYNTQNHFYNQLNSSAKKIYDAGYKGMVNGNSTGFSLSGAVTTSNVASALNALLNTYPHKFDWISTAKGSGFYWRRSGGTTKVSINKSDYYSASLENQANSKVNSLVSAAYTYARANYPNSVTYGLIRYFDEWICANNYYNNIGTYDDAYTRAGSTFYYCHTSYGVLLKGYGVCESYALAMDRLLAAAGIPNMYVRGYAGGLHSWNYVQMPNGRFYLLDSTWNDKGSGSNRKYLLVPKDSRSADGKHFTDGITFSFPSISSTAYSVATESIKLDQPVVYLTKGRTTSLTLSGGYYNGFVKTWRSSNTTVATVDDSGKVTAVAPGAATITLTLSSGSTLKCTVFVCEFTGLSFTANGKASYSTTYGAGASLTTQSYKLTVSQKSYATTASSICKALNIAGPSVTSNNAAVATATATLSGDTITLNVTPRSVGKATIKVTFAGKTATLTFTVKRAMQSGWFNLAYTSAEYTGKALKPKVSKTSAAPAGMKYSVKYSANTKVGVGTVTITGSGNYTGSVTKTFQITRANIAKASVSNPSAKGYTGTAKEAAITVKLNKKTLKKGTDYEIRYNGSAAAPTAAKTYTITIIGKGNYTGTASVQRTFTISTAKTSSAKLTLKSSVAYTGKAVNASTLGLAVKIGSQALPASDYTVSYRYPNGNTYSTAPSDKGKYTIIITPRGNNFVATVKAKTLTKAFTIK